MSGSSFFFAVKKIVLISFAAILTAYWKHIDLFCQVDSGSTRREICVVASQFHVITVFFP